MTHLKIIKRVKIQVFVLSQRKQYLQHLWSVVLVCKFDANFIVQDA